MNRKQEQMETALEGGREPVEEPGRRDVREDPAPGVPGEGMMGNPSPKIPGESIEERTLAEIAAEVVKVEAVETAEVVKVEAVETAEVAKVEAVETAEDVDGTGDPAPEEAAVPEEAAKPEEPVKEGPAADKPAEDAPGTEAAAGKETAAPEQRAWEDRQEDERPAPSTAQNESGTQVAGVQPPEHRAWEPEQVLDPALPETEKAARRHRARWISLLVVALLLLGIYGGGYRYASTHFMPGTKINGYDCGGLTDVQAEQVFATAAENYVLSLRFRGGDTEMLRAEEIGFAYKPDGSITALLQEQDRLLWPKYFFEEARYEINPGGTCEEEMLAQALAALPELQKENMEAPKDAYIRFQDGEGDEDGKFVIIPDTPGTTLDPVQLAAGVADAVAAYADLVDVEEISGAYTAADVQADNARLAARCGDLNDIVGASITYVFPDGGTLKLNADVMKDWLVKDKNGKLVKDDDVWDKKLWEFLEKLAMNCNTIGMDRQFRSTLRGTITVSGGYYGYMVNQVVEHDRLLEDLPADVKETRKPAYYITPYNEETENDGIGTTYIEVDLGAQHVWCYIDGELKMECDCVSGKTSDGHGTQAGVYGIMFMKKDATLRGVMQSNGEYEYETKVSYWMPFYTDTGFHDAWWRTAFGGTIYQEDGSHGCVNLPVDAAEQLFSYCDENMPVVVYY